MEENIMSLEVFNELKELYTNIKNSSENLKLDLENIRNENNQESINILEMFVIEIAKIDFENITQREMHLFVLNFYDIVDKLKKAYREIYSIELDLNVPEVNFQER